MTPPWVTTKCRPGPRSASAASTRSASWGTDSPWGAANASKSTNLSRISGEHSVHVDPSKSPKSSSRKRWSGRGSAYASRAVSTARIDGELTTESNSRGWRTSCKARACIRPRSFSGGSLHPQNLPAAVQSVSA
jgi:hypothetical protein